MQQLLMYYMDHNVREQCILPENYSFSNFQNGSSSDISAWVDICRNGRLLADDENGAGSYASAIGDVSDIDVSRDVFFLDYKGEHIGTFTAFVHPGDNTGDFHMVSIRKDFRGRGLSKYLCRKAIEVLVAANVRYIHLTTDDFRIPAIRSYLEAGFRPVNSDVDMEERWTYIMGKIKFDSAEFLNEDTSLCKIIRRPRNIVVYLGAKPGNEPVYAEAIRELGTWIGKSGCTLVYGGSKTGLMGEIAQSTVKAGGKVIGIEAAMFYDQNFQEDCLTELIVADTISERKNMMMEMGDVFIAFPGGTGTLDEVSELFVALSLGTKKAKCVMYNLNGYYDDLKNMLGKMVGKGFALKESMKDIYFAKDLDEIRNIVGEDL